MYNPIKLNEHEQTLLDGIDWQMIATGRGEYKERMANLELMGQLAECLMARRAIPAVRRKYFSKPEMNVGGHGKSHLEVFQRNLRAGQDVYRQRIHATT